MNNKVNKIEFKPGQLIWVQNKTSEGKIMFPLASQSIHPHRPSIPSSVPMEKTPGLIIRKAERNERLYREEILYQDNDVWYVVLIGSKLFYVLSRRLYEYIKFEAIK